MDEKVIELTTEMIQSITPDQAWHYLILPKSDRLNTIEFYHAKEKDSNLAIDELEVLFGKKITFHELPSEIIKKYLSKYYLRNRNSLKGNNGSVTIEDKNELKQDDFLLELINEANNLLCSDIHIETYEGASRIRLRIDGKLFERYIIKKDDYPGLINKIKILANLDIAEKRLPQDGRILFKSENQSFDIRVSIVPSLYGEKIVLRLLRKTSIDINITELGLNNLQLDRYLEGIKKPNGIILISGPTGSGKTTTLYATLNILNKNDVNIMTIEDPIEYTIEGLNQVQLREDIGLTFPLALKTFLRQDPDIIMLGEVRDPETAQMAIRAALTGHLVLSTIHTNSAWGIITRLIDMGIQPFLLSSTINTVGAQRLIRKLCSHCKISNEFDMTLLPAYLREKGIVNTHFTPGGCEHCHNSGYSGRVAVFEIINIDDELKENIHQPQNIVQHLLKNKEIKTLSLSAFELFSYGTTSLEEILPIISCES
jgi:general secretion pathway protein E/type IV pilus assembly protein PilB